jgi:hypothetical protein
MAQSELQKLRKECEELRLLNEKQGEMIGGYIKLVLAAKAAGVYFSWDGPIAVAENVRAQAVELKRAALAGALEGLKRGDNCWCEKAIDNPMYRDHSDACKKAAAALVQGAERV